MSMKEVTSIEGDTHTKGYDKKDKKDVTDGCKSHEIHIHGL